MKKPKRKPISAWAITCRSTSKLYPPTIHRFAITECEALAYRRGIDGDGRWKCGPHTIVEFIERRASRRRKENR